ncbi:MAG: hypothetical protein V4544_00040 [Pseudomonadota bacterium]
MLLLAIFSFNLHSGEEDLARLPVISPLGGSARIDFPQEELEEVEAVGGNFSLDNGMEAFLPFPYRSLSPEQLRKTTFVHERFYTVLMGEVEPEFAIVGPLSPCVFVGIRNNVNARVVIFHKMVVSSVASLIEIAQQELDVTDPSAIYVRIFANKLEGYEDPLWGIEGRSWQELHEGRSQIEELKFIREGLLKAFGLGRDQLKTQFHTSPHKRYMVNGFQNDLGDYVTANLCVCVNSSLDLHSICFVKENYFLGEESPVPSYFREISNKIMPELIPLPDAMKKQAIRILIGMDKSHGTSFSSLYIRGLGANIPAIKTMLASNVSAKHLDYLLKIFSTSSECSSAGCNSIPFKKTPSKMELEEIIVYVNTFPSEVKKIFPAGVVGSPENRKKIAEQYKNLSRDEFTAWISSFYRN